MLDMGIEQFNFQNAYIRQELHFFVYDLILNMLLNSLFNRYIFYSLNIKF